MKSGQLNACFHGAGLCVVLRHSPDVCGFTVLKHDCRSCHGDKLRGTAHGAREHSTRRTPSAIVAQHARFRWCNLRYNFAAWRKIHANVAMVQGEHPEPTLRSQRLGAVGLFCGM